MEFFKHKTNIDFMKLRNKAMVFSLLISLLSFASLAYHGLNLGLDFTGGTQLQMSWQTAQNAETIREKLHANHLPHPMVQTYGSNHRLMIRLGESSQSQTMLKKRIQLLFPHAHIERVEYIGPQVGEALLHDGLLAIGLSLLITMIYIAFRFEMRFALSAALSLIHDPIVILGAFSAFHLSFDLISLAALLTILGYSLNDTIVVYDRIRENFMLSQSNDAKTIVNQAINQTLSRTIMTSGLTLLVVIALFLLGGASLHGFAIALIIGIVIGTYSSIYIAGALAVMMGLQREHLLPSAKQNAEDLLP